MSLGRTTGKYSHSEKQIKTLNSGDDFPSIMDLTRRVTEGKVL
jgi:hypothetical protein